MVDFGYSGHFSATNIRLIDLTDLAKFGSVAPDKLRISLQGDRFNPGTRKYVQKVSGIVPFLNISSSLRCVRDVAEKLPETRKSVRRKSVQIVSGTPKSVEFAVL